MASNARVTGFARPATSPVAKQCRAWATESMAQRYSILTSSNGVAVKTLLSMYCSYGFVTRVLSPRKLIEPRCVFLSGFVDRGTRIFQL
jgi:hypothetical protein